MATLALVDYVNHWLKDAQEAQEFQSDYDDYETIAQAFARY
jgi:hypothetical protein